MSKHINFIGYSIWIPIEIKHERLTIALENNQTLYSPSALAGYSLLISPGVGTILYGINIYRRGEQVKGTIFIVFSFIFMLMSIFANKHINIFIDGRNSHHVFMFSNLVAISLYQLEKSHFDRAMRNGFCKARWWLPLLGVLLFLTILWLFYMI